MCFAAYFVRQDEVSLSIYVAEWKYNVLLKAMVPAVP